MAAQTVRKAVIPAGEFANGILPAAKAVPHEMLPLVDRPLIQYAVDEALAAGIEEIVIVSGRGKGAIEDHFDCAAELEDALRRGGRREALDAVAATRARAGAIAFIRQQEPLGMVHALWCARHVLGSEPFAVLVPDQVIRAEIPCLARMMAVHGRLGGNLVAVTPAARGRPSRYGVVTAIRRDERTLVASPAMSGAETWAATGRFILDQTMIARLDGILADGDRPLIDVLTDAAADCPLHGYVVEGRHFDCGAMLGLLEANIALALERADLAPSMRGLLARYGQEAARAGRPRAAEAPGLRIPA